MNCNCKTEMEKSMVDEMDYHGKKILSAEMDAMLMFKKSVLKLFTSTNCTLKVEGRKSEVRIPVKHSYCPFCGIKADEFEEETEKELNQVTG